MTKNLSDLKHTTERIEGGGEVIVIDTGAVIDAEAEAMLQALHSRSTGGLPFCTSADASVSESVV